MSHWNVLLSTGDDLAIAADRMTITDAGALVFWAGHEGQFADRITWAFADGHWWSVSRTEPS